MTQQFPQARITIELTSVRHKPYDTEFDPSLSEMDNMGAQFIERQLRDMFAGDGTLDVSVIATHTLVEREPAAA